MKPDAFERDIRKILEEVEYRPSEESWQKMQQALSEGRSAAFPAGMPTTTVKKKPFWSISRAVAAACFGVLATGAVLFYVNNNRVLTPGQEFAGGINQGSKPLAEQLSNTGAGNKSIDVLQPATVVVPGLQFASKTTTGPVSIADLEHPSIDPLGSSLAAATLDQVYSAGINVALETRNALNPVSKTTERYERFKIAEDMGSRLYSVADWSDNPEHTTTFEDPFIYGISVKGGLPKVGPMQFNAGMTVKRDWSKRIYTEANLDVSYTDVRYQKALYYKRNDNGSFTNLGDLSNVHEAMAASGGKGKASAYTYGNHVIGVGLAVLGGYNVTKDLSVAVGADMYRNFNNKLVLDASNPLVEATSLKNTINPVKWINVWDAGAKAQIRYRVSDYVTVFAQGRYGLVDYIASEDGTKIENSSAGLGVNISLNP